VGLLDYYRQFDDVDEEVINRRLRERRARERALALERVPTIDLSSSEWPDFPNSEIVNASIAAARGRVNGYPDRHATVVRESLAARRSSSRWRRWCCSSVASWCPRGPRTRSTR
jgi:histidinol-phosphate/aromatic aminotransferase/cobyric acid decarboxylase-like protein